MFDRLEAVLGRDDAVAFIRQHALGEHRYQVLVVDDHNQLAGTRGIENPHIGRRLRTEGRTTGACTSGLAINPASA